MHTHKMKYIVYHEQDYYVAQCLNVDVSSFGKTIEESITNLKEAVELFLEDDNGQAEFQEVGETLIGDAVVNG